MLTQKRLKELLNYDSETGAWTWLIKPNKNISVGAFAGTNSPPGYRTITVDHKRYLAHRLAWLYMTGSLPTHIIDHIDGDGINLRWSNLRNANAFQNAHNKRVNKNSSSGLKGAEPHRDKWTSRIYVHGVRIYLGQFNCPTAAHFAYLRAAKKHYGEFATGRM